MRVAIVSPYDLSRPGGVQGQVLELRRVLDELGHDAWVVGPRAPKGSGVDVGGTIAVPGNGSRAPISIDPRSVVRSRSAVKGADVVHVHEPMMPLVGPAVVNIDLPVVATFHASPPNWAEWAYRRIPPSWMSRKVLTAVSEVAAAALPWPARIIPNGVDVASFRSGEHRHPARVAFLGRNEPRKGLPILVDAWAVVRAQVPEAELIVMGSHGRDQDGIRYLGRVDEENKRTLLASSAVFVAPNTGGESFGITVVEAMAAGCAVIASDLPPFRDVAGDGAVYFPPGDSSELADQLISLLLDQKRTALLGSSAAASVRRYDWSVVAPLYLDSYRDAISGRSDHG